MEEMEQTLSKEKRSAFNDEEITPYLLEIARWGKFLAIVGYVGMGLIVLIAIGIIIGFSALSVFKNFGTGFPLVLLGFVYLGFAVIYYFPVTYLYRFSDRMKQGILLNEQFAITSGFKSLKSLFRFLGIFTIVVLSIYALSIIVFIPVSLLLFK